MKYVLDSSVAFKWVVPESDTPKAVKLRDEFRSAVHELISPDVFPTELAHALTGRSARAGSISDAVIRLIDVLTTCPILIPSLPLLLRACRHLLDHAGGRLRLPLRRPGRAGGVRAGHCRYPSLKQPPADVSLPHRSGLAALISVAIAAISVRCRRFSRVLCVSRRDEDGRTGLTRCASSDRLAHSSDSVKPKISTLKSTNMPKRLKWSTISVDHFERSERVD